MRIACAFVLACSVAACVPGARAPSVDLASERLQLMDLDRAFSSASVGRGADAAFAAYLAENAVELSDADAPPLQGRNAIVASLHSKPGDQRFTLKWSPDDGAVATGGDLGYTWGHYELVSAAKEGAPSTTTHGKYLTVWRKDVGGRWRAIVDIGNK